MRQAILDLEASKIREVANAGLGRTDVLAFWFGESDEVTPSFVRQAAIDSLQQGETFYAHNLGLPALRAAIAHTMTQRHAAHEPARAIGVPRVAVTSGGVNALMLAMQALLDAGDEVVAVTPVWPNLTAQPGILGAQVRTVSLRPRQGAWSLDLSELLEAITPRTRLLVVNAPNNPTGWTLTREEQGALLAHCRRTGTWILADEVYENLYYGPTLNGCAPSFLDVAEPDDRLVVAHSFSKSFLMTGWRLGWMVVPEDVVDPLGKLTEFNTSCAPVFVQRAGVLAVQQSSVTVPPLREHMRACADRLVRGLKSLPGVEVAQPMGGMYAFLRVPGRDDSLAFAKHLVTAHGLGLAPGAAFGPEGEGWLRWCFASKDLARLDLGVQRLAAALK